MSQQPRGTHRTGPDARRSSSPSQKRESWNNGEDTRQRRLLTLQGWTGADLDQATETGIWQRMSPALCLTFTIVGTALASPLVLVALAVTAIIGALAPGHPFDALYNHGIRHLLQQPRLPPSRAARRSACAIASFWLVATAITFWSGATLAGYVLGGLLAGAGAVFTFAGFCIPSFLFNTFLGRERACRPDLVAAVRR